MSFNSDFSTLSFLHISSLLILSDRLIFVICLKIHILNAFIKFFMSMVNVQVSQPHVNAENNIIYNYLLTNCADTPYPSISLVV